MDSQSEALFVIKNGSGSKPDVQIRASLSSTVAQLKSLIQHEYPGNPAPTEQTVSVHGLRMPASRLRRLAHHTEHLTTIDIKVMSSRAAHLRRQGAEAGDCPAVCHHRPGERTCAVCIFVRAASCIIHTDSRKHSQYRHNLGTSKPSMQDVKEPISMHMVVKSHPPPSAPAPQPAGAPAAAASSRRTPQPAAAASTGQQPAGRQPQTSTSPAGPSASRSSGHPSPRQSNSIGTSASPPAAAGAPYQPDATSAWMQYQNAAAAAAWVGSSPWAMPQVHLA